MKTGMRRLIREEKGAALALTLVLLLIGGLIITPVIRHMGTGIIAGGVHEKRMGELYAADAGVEDAIWKIQNPDDIADWPDPTCADSPWEEPYEYELWVDGRDVTLSIEYLGNDNYRVISTATDADGSTTIVESRVFWGSHWKEILNFGVIALDGDITITGTSVLDSSPDPNAMHIYADGNISIGGNSQVKGSATASGDISDASRVTPGPVNDDYHPPIEFGLPDLSVYWKEAMSGEFIDVSEDPDNTLVIDVSRSIGPAYINGDLHVTSDALLTLTGPVWVEGDIKTDGKTEVTGRAPLVAEGMITMVGGAALDTEEMPVVISTVDHEDIGSDYSISFEGSADAYMVLYAPVGLIDVSGSGAVNGAIIGRAVNISIAANVNAVYDLEVVNRVRAKQITIETWEMTAAGPAS